MKKKNLKTLLFVAAAGLLLCVEIIIAVKLISEPGGAGVQSTEETQIFTGLTWEEYQSLSLEEQDQFFEQFASQEDFEAWLEAVKPTETEPTVSPWEESGKRPNEYTWEEYQQLTGEEREAFMNWFDSKAAFEAWLESVQTTETTEFVPVWNRPGKQPNEYTWEEYQALTPEEQEAFFLWFDSLTAFEKWMNSVKPADLTEPAPQWNKPGKLPNEYTWEEYQALTPEEQEAFFLWFDSLTAFEKWMNSVKPADPTEPAPQWNKPGKLPNEYTWEEYQALTPEEQEAFFLWFASEEAFEAWMDAAKGG